ncbi:LysE family translocator [Thalassotalea eurytherma]|uniref:Amino acid transporter LysE n=1 Tax=Thalassotalea eurytherma TaxID=1144278 RepID=A0ABQ6H5Q7_9GAMM|nr:LysE family translocator [Thalassotalea eurytherma]GLX82819.1 amino acid transporter LysE [Thalassotalea eurytherma]
MEFHLWLSLVLICVLGALSPGPSLALVIKNTIHGGAKQGYATAISHGLGVAIYAGACIAGLGVLIVNSPVLFQFLQYGGAAFLVYLGVKALLAKKPSTNDDNQAVEINVNGWRDGFLIAFLNPKLAIFFIALFSQFIDASASIEQKMIMVSTVGLIDGIWYCLVTFALTRGNIIEKLRNNSHIVDKVTGVVLISLATRVVLQ